MVFRDKILIWNTNSITSCHEIMRCSGYSLYALNKSLYNLISLLYIEINSLCIFVPSLFFVIHFSWYVSKSFMQCNIMSWGYKYSVCCTTFIFWYVKISMYSGKTFMYSGESVITMVNPLYNVLIYYMRLLSNTTFPML